MTRALACWLAVAAVAQALTVETVSFGFDSAWRRHRPTPLVVRVTSSSPFRGDLEITGGPVTRVFPLDFPAGASRELRMTFAFPAAAEVSWKAGAETGTLDLKAKEAGTGEALVAVEREAVARRVDTYRTDFPPASRFFFADFENEAPAVFAAADAVILKDRGGDRAAFLDGLPGSGAFRARGGAVLWVDGPKRDWWGKVDASEDPDRGVELYGAFERTKWREAGKPYAWRMWLLAIGPVVLAAFALAILPGGRAARLGGAVAVLAGGTVLAALSGPATLDACETFEVEVARGRAFDRLTVTAFTTPVDGEPAWRFATPADPSPSFFSVRDAQDRRVRLVNGDAGFVALPGRVVAGSTLAFESRGVRSAAGSMGVADGQARNDTDRDLTDVFVIGEGRASWIGDLPRGALVSIGSPGKISELRSHLGATAHRRIWDFWWRRADRGRRWLVGFAKGRPTEDGPALTSVHHGVLVVIPLD